MSRFLFAAGILLPYFLPSLLYAHSISESEESTSFVEGFFIFDDGALVTYTALALLILTGIVLAKRPRREGAKRFFFWTITALVLAVTGYISAHTVYENAVLSPTGGPVHWHADFRIFQCGKELDIVDPKGLSNRVGTPLIHEHNDKRIHVEGTIFSLKDASLEIFFEKIGGALAENILYFETNDGPALFKNGDLCPDGKSGILQVFLWQTENGVLRQSKLENFADYVISPHALVPPGDCIIFEFSEEKRFTEYLCEQYAVAESRGDLQIEFPPSEGQKIQIPDSKF